MLMGKILSYLRRAETPRQVQEKFDLMTVDLLVKYKTAMIEKYGDQWATKDFNDPIFRSENQELMQSFSKDTFDEKKARNLVTQFLDEQVKDIFASLDSTENKKLTFSLEEKQSDIPEAGNGTFLKGVASPGTVVAFYPGILYEPPFFQQLPNFPNFDKDNSYLFLRSDDCIIDAKDYSHTKPIHKEVIQQKYVNHLRGERDFNLIENNPFALGHKINHPSQGKRSNVIAFPYNFNKYFPEKWKELIPNKFIADHPIYYPLTVGFMKTVIFITTRFVKDEELLLNYRFNPKQKEKFPSWYSPLDAEQNERLWVNEDDKKKQK